MSPVTLNVDQFKELATSANDAPVIMLNLLKFKADNGLTSYLRYTKEAGRFVDRAGGKVLYLGKAKELLNGEETWDAIMLVQYPSRKAFVQMANDPEYIKIHEFREAALDRAVLYATDPTTFVDLKAKAK
jgi:uncharacterized protein (DUF1330 family)